MSSRRPSPIGAYVGVLGVAVVALVAGCIAGWRSEEPLRWLTFAVLFGIAEHVDIFFHHERGRQSLNPSEAILLPMVVILPLQQVVLGVVAAMVVIRLVHWREGALRFVFNVAQYGLAAAAAAGVWDLLGGTTSLPSPFDALAAMLAVLVFAAISHVLVAGALSLVGGTNIMALLRDVTGTATLYHVGNALIGLLLAAAYATATWTISLFPLMLLLLALGSRALLRQSAERQRAEHLLSAARALAAGVHIESAITGFLAAVVEVMSAVEAVALVHVREHLGSHRVRRGGQRETAEQVSDPRLLRAFDAVSAMGSVVATPEVRGEPREFLKLFDAHNLVAVSLQESGRVVGALIAVDRVGAEDFGPGDARLLEALGEELIVSLTSFRLFDQVMMEREKFQQIFRSSAEGIALVDASGVVQAWNPALEQMTGLKESQVLGSVWSDRISLIDEFNRYIPDAELSLILPDEKLQLVTERGLSRWVSVFPGPVGPGMGGSVVLVRDLTSEYELERSKTDFLATVSHELRTPLTGIKGSLDVLGKYGPQLGPRRLKKLIEMTTWGANRLERLVMNLLLVSDISAGDMPIRSEPVELRTLVRERIDGALAGHSLTDLIVPDYEVTVEADQHWLAQAVDNVLDNARKFGGERGRITVTVEAVDGAARISVSDEGRGVPETDRDRIFERFVRLGDVSTRQMQEGAGVGLYIARRSMEAMGGTVFYDDSSGDPTFLLHLPLLSGQPSGEWDLASLRRDTPGKPGSVS
jgi:PAS domain S-box-containing protein